MPSSLIILAVHTLCAHTHLLQQFCHAWQHSWRASIMGHRPAVALHLMSNVTKHWLRSPICSLEKSQKSLGARCGEYGGFGMSVICFPAKNYCIVRIACADPHKIPTSFKTSLMVICWLACISPFEILSAFTVRGLPLQGSFSRNSCPLLKLLYQAHTAIFLKSIIPINSLQVLHCLCSTLPFLAH